MSAPLGSTILKLVIYSLVVGLVLSFFDITPLGLLKNFGETIREIFDLVTRNVGKLFGYILLGAVIVVPIFAIKLALDAIARRRRGE